jgi:hypothetical protein
VVKATGCHLKGGHCCVVSWNRIFPRKDFVMRANEKTLETKRHTH